MRVQTSSNIDIYLTTFKWPYFGTAYCYSHVVGPTGSPTCTVYVDVTLTRSKVKVTGLLNSRQLAKPCMRAAMTAAPLRGFLVSERELTFAICCRPSVCRMSVTLVCPRQAVEVFSNFSTPFGTLAIP